MIRMFLFLISTALAPEFCFGQSDWGLEVRLRSGFLGVHRPTVSHLPQERVFAGELSYFLVLNDSNNWSKEYEKPRIGLTTFFSQTGNTPILGHLFGVYAFGDLPFFKAGNFVFNAKIGAGLAIATKIFDPIENPKNNAISTYLNGAVVLGLHLRYDSGQSSFGFGTEMSHFSNGAITLPNLGLNFPFLAISYGRKFGQSDNSVKTIPFQRNNLPWRFGISGIISTKEVYPTDGRKYPIAGLNLFARKIWSPKVGLEVALDGIYNSSILDYLSEFEKKPIDVVQVGIFAGYVLSFDRFSTILGLGGYVRDRYLPNDWFYNRIGMRYLFKNNLQLGGVLKSNWGRADYWEISLGYLFQRK